MISVIRQSLFYGIKNHAEGSFMLTLSSTLLILKIAAFKKPEMGRQFFSGNLITTQSTSFISNCVVGLQ